MKTYKKLIPKLSLVKERSDIPCVQIKSSKDVNDYVRRFYSGDIEIIESMFLILLNKSNNTEGFVKISQGGTAGTVCDIKIIAKYAIESLSASCVLVHNHPSGNNQPSEADKATTKRVKEALDLLDICLIDHVIITPYNGHYSFADNCLLTS